MTRRTFQPAWLILLYFLCSRFSSGLFPWRACSCLQSAFKKMIIQFMQNNLPISPEIIADNIESIIASRNVIGVFSVLGLSWTSSNMFTSIGAALDRSCGACERRSFFLRKPRDILFALAAGFLFLLAGVLPTVFGLIPEVDVPFSGPPPILRCFLSVRG